MKLILGLIFVTLAIFFGFWVIAFVLAIFALLGIAWLCGIPITVTVGGKKMIYRWTKRIA